jgi:hypothetical protein
MKYIINASPSLLFKGNKAMLETIDMGDNIRVVISGENQGEVNTKWRIASDVTMSKNDFNKYILPTL